MVDNPKNTTTDDEPFDFGADWGETESSDGEFNPEDVDFGTETSGFGETAVGDPFGATLDDDPFTSSGDDIFSNTASFEDDSSYHTMPTPDNLSAEMEGEANPDEDFSDISSDGDFNGFNEFEGDNSESQSFSTQDGFDDSDNLFETETADNAFASDDDGFGGQDNNVYEEEDAFSSSENNDELAEAPAAVEKSGGGFNKSTIVKVGLVAAVIGIGYVGYSSVVPMFLGSEEQAPTVVNTSLQPPVNQFPAALPGQDGGLPLPAPVASGTTSTALPTIPVTVGESNLPPVLESASNTQADDKSNDNNTVSSLPGFDNGQQSSLFPSVDLTLPSQSSEDDLVGGDRGGITALRDRDETENSKPVSDQTAADIKTVLKRIAALETSFNSEIKSLSNEIDSRLTVLETKMATNSKPEEVTPTSIPHSGISNDAQPPLKPTIIENMTLKGVSRGMAWVKTATGIIEARVGDNIAEAGRVLGISEYNGAWMVSTDKGLILQ